MKRLVVGALLAAALAAAFACGGSPSAPVPQEGVPILPPCEAEPRLVVRLDDERVACPPRQEIDTINRDISITFQNDATAGSLVCRQADGSADLTHLQALTYMQIAYMRRMSFSRPLPWTDKDLYDWFRTAIRGIVVRTGTDTSYCCSPSKVIHMVYYPAALNPDSLTASRLDAGILVHEARHAEIGPHTCNMTTDPKQPKWGDHTIAQMGASGVQYLLYEWLGKYSSEAQTLKNRFLLLAWGIRNQQVFCNECYRPSRLEP